MAHISTSQAKKEWPVERWGELGKLALAAGVPLAFSSGVSPRERRLLEGLAECFPEARILDPASSLGEFIAVIARAGVFVSGDTGPLHLAAGLGLPTLGIFGPSDARQWLPIGKTSESVSGGVCECSGHRVECQSSAPCISGVSVQSVWKKVVDLYQTHKSHG
jgi:ADP-heptose:LPS heptosyltransferase